MKMPADIIAEVANAKPPHCKPVELTHPTRCALSGVEIVVGYPVLRVVPKSYSRSSETFRDTNGYVSESVAVALANDWNFGCRVILEDGTHYHCLISREQAEKQGRPCFSEVVREIWPQREGQSCVILITTDVKKRLWPLAKPGRLGESTPVAVLASEYNTEETRWCNWERLLSTLTTIERLYGWGFNKDAIRRNLYNSKKGLEAAGFSRTRTEEENLVLLRTLPEFIPALVIAQPDTTTPLPEKSSIATQPQQSALFA